MKFKPLAENFYGEVDFAFDKEGKPIGFGCVDGLSEHRREDLHDALYDCAGVTIAQNENGELFAYETIYKDGNFVPAVWQRIHGYTERKD